eukprot:CAMPEP_0196801958 /NCGR_PEP_ID=MMETSP1362-20130617/1718_1 /TAXON_ID=163516 /ORGANISM="Leptocylindrus danicus, Strain CCMP1856" /LENGTH=246 /DNA_ID=CAMNT_0042173149 /DNA_START=68 /DNA_END=809 /DNA_ORIENTATION=+
MNNCQRVARNFLWVLVVVRLSLSSTHAFTSSGRSCNQQASQTYLQALKVGSSYEPKWKKRKTLAEEVGESGAKDPSTGGLVGNIEVVFNQGNETRSTLALAGQPLSSVAAQAGQFIRYGCKKGECGTCQAMCDGKWIRPCVVKVPDVPKGEQYVVTLNAIKNKSKSSGKFFSIRSFFMGFYNNLLGMVGFVKQRRAARKNYLDRMDIEDNILKLAEEKRKAAEAAEEKKALDACSYYARIVLDAND